MPPIPKYGDKLTECVMVRLTPSMLEQAQQLAEDLQIPAGGTADIFRYLLLRAVEGKPFTFAGVDQAGKPPEATIAE